MPVETLPESSPLARTPRLQGSAMLPFYISKLFGTQFKTHGFAIAGEEGIRLVFRDEDDDTDESGDESRSVLVTWENFHGLEARKGFIKDSATIHVASTEGLHDLPGLSERQVALEVQKRDRQQLETFQREVEDFRTGCRSNDVDEVLDDVRDFLDRI